jgi:ABC-type transport system involved in multi-copper enzyme maturation permease subunit
MMFKKIVALARLEMLQQLVSGRFNITVAICIILTSLTILISCTSYKNEMAAYSQRVEVHKRDVGTYSTAYGTPLFMLETGGVMIDRPIWPIQVLATSSFSSISESYWVNMEAGVRPITPLAAAGLDSLFQRLDFLFLITYVFSIVALVFSYDAVCGEKESRMLALTLSRSISRAQYLMGKILGGLIVQFQLILLMFLLALLLISFSPFIRLDGDFLLRFGLVFILTGLYIAIFYLVGVLVSTSCLNSTTSVIICLGFWLVFSHGIPVFAPLIAERASPQPFYRDVVKAEEDDLGFDFISKVQEYKRQGVSDAFAAATDYKEGVVDEQKASRQRQVRAEFINGKWSQVNLTRNILTLSPTGNFQVSAANLLAFGPYDIERFDRSVEVYRQQLRDYIKTKKAEAGTEENRKNIDISSYPKFQLQPSPLEEVFVDSRVHLSVMIGLLLCLLLVTYFQFRHYDVR